MFEHACRMGLEGIVSKRLELALPKRPIQDLAEVEEPPSVKPSGGNVRKTGITDAKAKNGKKLPTNLL